MFFLEQRIVEYEKDNPLELTKEQFSKLRQEVKRTENDGTISDELADFILWSKGLPSRQEKFAKYITKFIPCKSSVLEIGCGRTARMSRILRDMGYNVSCMDPKVDASYLGDIKSFSTEFNYKTTEIEEYDYLVAQEPCEATEHIVRACVSKRKPFIMSICGVPHRLLNGKILASAEEWYEYLLNISPNQLRLRYAKLDPLTDTPILKSTF